MNRAVFWPIFGALALAILGAAWFFIHFDRVPTTRWEKPGKEALHNPYLALERFTTRMGRPLARIGNALALDRLPAGGVLLLDRSRRVHLNPKRADALFEWVKQGGYLIVAAEAASVDDPVLKRLGIQWAPAPEAGDENGGGQGARPAGGAPEPAAGQCPSTAAAIPPHEDSVAVRWPDGERIFHLKIGAWDAERGLRPSAPAPLWRAGSEASRAVLLHYAHGGGWITVLEDFGFLANWNIGEYDHAELVWELMERYGPEGELRLAARLEVPTLWEWLAESAWMALVSAGLLIAAWLWAIMPRFGGVLPAAAPARRGLAEHLAAVGRAVWREGGLDHWSNVARQDLRESIARRYPHIPQLPEAERIAALARIGGANPELVAAVLTNEGEISPEAFTAMARMVGQIEQKL